MGHQQSKEVTPFFVFPGLSDRNALVDRFRQSLYPVFIVDLPPLPSASLSDYAACAVPVSIMLQNTHILFLGSGENHTEFVRFNTF